MRTLNSGSRSEYLSANKSSSRNLSALNRADCSVNSSQMASRFFESTSLNSALSSSVILSAPRGVRVEELGAYSASGRAPLHSLEGHGQAGTRNQARPRYCGRFAAGRTGSRSARCSAKRISSSPSTARISSLVVEIESRAGRLASGSALVDMDVRVLLCKTSPVACGSGRSGSGSSVCMEPQSQPAQVEAPARRAAAPCTFLQDLQRHESPRNAVQGSAS